MQKPPVPPLSLQALHDFPMVTSDDDLASLLIASLEKNDIVLQTNDVLVMAQKIVSKAEGRLVRLSDVTPSPRAHEVAEVTGKDPRMIELILSESQDVIAQRPDLIIVEHRLGYIMANAGVDQSNIEHPDGEECALLLPLDPDGTCAQLKAALDAHFNADVAVLINDSFGRPWRQGITGVALGAAGLPSLVSLIDKPDLYGRAMRVSEIAFADELAAAASLLMGQTDAAKPVVHVRGLTWDAANNNPARTLLRPKKQDLFR